GAAWPGLAVVGDAHLGLAAGHRDDDLAIDQPGPVRRGRRRAAACARRERVSRAALPDPDREVAPRAHLRELDVGPIRERRVALDEWTEPWDIERRDVVDEKDKMRIAERDDRDPYTSASDLELVDVGEGGAAHAVGHPCHPIAVPIDPVFYDPARSPR